MNYILGISAFYHDSAACLLKDGEIIAAAQEERFTRKKHDATFPNHAIQFCLAEAKIQLHDIEYVVFYDKPFLKFERLLETYLRFAPRGLKSFVTAIPIWIKEKLFIKQTLKKELREISPIKANNPYKLLFNEHHRSHASSAFFPSPFQKAAVLCLDGVGEWATSSVWVGDGNTLNLQWEIDFPHSLGLLYSAFTYYTGFKVNSGEYKLMGLAPYGEPKYVDLIFDHLVNVKADGTFRLNMDYFDFATGLRMTNNRFDKLFGGPPRKSESEVTAKEMDIARSIQVVTEEIILRLIRAVHAELKLDYLCLAGGVALNCVANGRILREGPFKDIWIQPAAGDAGGALGAAYSAWYEYLKNPREAANTDKMQGSYLGKGYSNAIIGDYLHNLNANFTYIEDKELLQKVASLLANGNVIGWFQGRSEFGPRALGNRSILGDPRNPDMQSVMNLKIKYRESFRPFAPAVKVEKAHEWFEIDRPSPYMLLVAPVKPDKRVSSSSVNGTNISYLDKLKRPRSQIPAVTHIDYSARIQTVHKETNSRFYDLLDQFEKETGCPILINTSFNVRGEPIVCSPQDAYLCFMRTEIDYLVIENHILAKKDQPKWTDDEKWKKEFNLD